MKNILIGTAWLYANNSFHIGHLAGLLPSDVIARYHRMIGNNVFFVSGTDCHGTPISLAAKKLKVNPLEIATKYHNEFKRDFNALNFSFDYYGATFNEDHKAFVKKCFEIIKENGYFYEQTKPEDYCLTCNEFLSDRQIVGTCPHCHKPAKGDQCDFCMASFDSSELLDKKCAVCGHSTILKDNTHMYFKLSSFIDVIRKLVDEQGHNWRSNAVNETVKYFKLGLFDRAVTRQMDWGVEVPFDNFEDKRIYVWFEAVLGYLSTIFKLCAERNQNFDEIMTSQDTVSYYVHGKDNIFFHTVIYPALINSINKDYNLPNYIISSEFLNVGQDKMSKSLGNLISVNTLIENYDSDSIRYYFIACGPERKDMSFSIDDFVQHHNKFLVGVIGNFINRNTSFVCKKLDGKFVKSKIDSLVIEQTKTTYEQVGDMIAAGKLKAALEAVKDYAVFGNKYYDNMTPWVAFNQDRQMFDDISYTCMYMIANLANMLKPFIPNAASKIFELIGVSDNGKWEEIKLTTDIVVKQNKIIFERIEQKELVEKVETNMTEQNKTEKVEQQPQQDNFITFEDFSKVEMKVGFVLDSVKVEGSDKLLKNTVQLGDTQRTIVSGISTHYTPNDIIGKYVVVVTNLKPRKIKGIESQGMILCAYTENDEQLKLITVDGEIKTGSEVG